MVAADAWPTVVAALGASFLTSVGSFGVVQWQRWRDGKAKKKSDRFAAYAELHSRSLSFVNRVQALGLQKQVRSGLAEGLDVTMGRRKPADALELHDWLNVESRPLYDAYSRVCLVGTQAAIDVANLINATGTLLDAALATDESRSRAARLVGGETQTPAQAQHMQEALQKLTELRKDFAAVIRQEAGADAVILPIQQTKLKKAGDKT